MMVVVEAAAVWVGGDCLGFWLLKGKVTLEI
jgi:hypothetical protein